jgi:hypothetical protein
MISALLVKEDFVLITAGNKYAWRAISFKWPEGGQNSRAVSVDWVGGGRGPVADDVSERVYPPWILYGDDGAGQDLHLR